MQFIVHTLFAFRLKKSIRTSNHFVPPLCRVFEQQATQQTKAMFGLGQQSFDFGEKQEEMHNKEVEA